MKPLIRRLLGLGRRARFHLWRLRTAVRLRWLGMSLDARAEGPFQGPLPRVRVGEAPTAGSGSLELRIGDGVRFEPGVTIDLRGGADSRLLLGDRAILASNVRLVLRGGSIELGPEAHLYDGVVVKAAGRIVMGRGYQVRYMSVIHCEELITLDGGGGIADRVTMSDIDHLWDPRDVVWTEWPVETAPIHLGRNTAVYSNSIIGKGVTIGPNSVVAATSVVRAGDYPAASFLAGIPAKLVRINQ